MASCRKEFKQAFMAIATIHSPKWRQLVATKISAMSTLHAGLAPRVADHTAIFQWCYGSTSSISVSIALETAVTSSFPNSRLFRFAESGQFCFRNSLARQCYHLTLPYIVAIMLLFSRLLSIAHCSSSNPSSWANSCNRLLRYGYRRHHKSMWSL